MTRRAARPIRAGSRRDSPASRARLCGRARGFTLIELLIAVSLMAVLAVMGWRGLDSVVRGREHITESSDALRALSVTFTQLEDDLRRSWPARLMNPGMPPIAFVEEVPGAPPAMHLLRELPPDSGAAQLQRVVWRLRGGVLERGFGAFVMPAADGAMQAPQLTWQPLIGGVTTVHARAWIPGRGWLPSAALLQRPGLAPDQQGAITGMEILVEREGGERVLRVFSLRD
ncbi:MAG TPA: prepilin-type N-terminal cleavage/methylation domain-containing protein [Quisquiliibacterium sp.]|nr:prepilin-type N-terminal cleavage/methylation domain-containing protein [Quisquiliibacterium sp.]